MAERVLLISAITIVLGALFLTTYSLALGDPVPHRIDAALIGNRSANLRAVDAVEHVARGELAFSHYRSVSAALHAIDEQQVYAALEVTPSTATLYVASAAGASVARVLEQVYALDRAVRVIDTHPLASDDPGGVDIFFLMLVATVLGFITVFQVRAQAGDLGLRRHVWFVVGFALVAALMLTFVDGPLLHRPAAVYPEEWGILALQLLAAESFASLMAVLIGPWAIIPTWLFFIILGNASSGGAVAPPLLPQPFAFLSQWLPSGATVTSLRNAIYFRHYQHAGPLAVLSVWGLGLFVTWLVVSQRELSNNRRGRGSALVRPSRMPRFTRAAQQSPSRQQVKDGGSGDRVSKLDTGIVGQRR